MSEVTGVHDNCIWYPTRLHFATTLAEYFVWIIWIIPSAHDLELGLLLFHKHSWHTGEYKVTLIIFLAEVYGKGEWGNDLYKIQSFQRNLEFYRYVSNAPWGYGCWELLMFIPKKLLRTTMKLQHNVLWLFLGESKINVGYYRRVRYNNAVCFIRPSWARDSCVVCNYLPYALGMELC